VGEDAGVAASRPIRFGTSGWRGVLGDEFTFARARAAVRGVGEWLFARAAGARVLVAHDRRFLGERFAEQACGVLAACGVRPLPVRGSVATPVVAHALRVRRAEAALVFTASHNPPEYQGLKVLGPGGASLGAEETRRIEALAAEALRREVPEAAVHERPRGLVEPYLKALLACVDAEAFRRRRPVVHYDALHGAGAGLLDEALRRLGARVSPSRLEPDPGFGGGAPDPLPERLLALRRALARGRGLRLGLATDGDADRYAALDADGTPLRESDALALLVDHLARSGRVKRGVALSIATGSLVERVASAHGLAVTRHPIGFKYLAASFAAGEADVAGEESGGFAWSRLSFDKDGVLAGCLLSELVAVTRVPLGESLRALRRRFGASACGRIAVEADAGARAALARRLADPPARVGSSPVRSVSREDGLRLGLDDGFLLLRASGTEPRLRVYAEAPDEARLARRLAAGRRLLADTPGGRFPRARR
jgi:phosphomannomutase